MTGILLAIIAITALVGLGSVVFLGPNNEFEKETEEVIETLTQYEEEAEKRRQEYLDENLKDIQNRKV